MSSSNNGDYDWYYSTADQRYYHYNDRNRDAFTSTNSPGPAFADTSCEPQGSNDLQILDLETAKRGGYKLGLKLTKTPSLLSLFSTDSQTDDNLYGSPEKLKAVNFPALSLQIGSWMRESKHEGDLVTKCYFKKRQLVWEVLNGNLKNKIEFQWSNITAIKATFHANSSGVLDIMLKSAPLFFHEINPQPRKHTNWEHCSDFTGGQASLIRKHRLIFGPGVLEKHYNKIIQADSKLHYISQQPFPYQASMYFDEIHFSNQLSFDNHPVALPPQIPLSHPPVMDFSGYNTSANYQVHQDISSLNDDDQQYYVQEQSQFAISSSASQESTEYQQFGYVYPGVNAPMTNDVGLHSQGYSLQQYNEALRSDLACVGESHQSSYEYEDGVVDHYHQFSNEYQSQYYNAGGHQWL